VPGFAGDASYQPAFRRRASIFPALAETVRDGFPPASMTRRLMNDSSSGLFYKDNLFHQG
jgi:hypothetical protein